MSNNKSMNSKSSRGEREKGGTNVRTQARLNVSQLTEEDVEHHHTGSTGPDVDEDGTTTFIDVKCSGEFCFPVTNQTVL